MPDADSNDVPSFHGDFRFGVDESRRVMIPAKWRPKDPKVVFTAVLWPIEVEEFLLVLPPERWQRLLEKLKTNSLNDKRVATLERVLGTTSVPLVLDKVGRFCLPDALAGKAGIEEEARFIGRVDKFEIWSPKRCTVVTPEDKALAAAVAEELNL